MRRFVLHVMVFLVFLALFGVSVFASPTVTITNGGCTGDVWFNLSGATNAHAAIQPADGYTHKVCFTGYEDSEYVKGQDGGTIIKLSGETNAHAQTKEKTGYSVEIKRKGISCRVKGEGDLATDEFGAFSLNQETNAHVFAYSDPDGTVKIVCKIDSCEDDAGRDQNTLFDFEDKEVGAVLNTNTKGSITVKSLSASTQVAEVVLRKPAANDNPQWSQVLLEIPQDKKNWGSFTHLEFSVYVMNYSDAVFVIEEATLNRKKGYFRLDKYAVNGYLEPFTMNRIRVPLKDAVNDLANIKYIGFALASEQAHFDQAQYIYYVDNIVLKKYGDSGALESAKSCQQGKYAAAELDDEKTLCEAQPHAKWTGAKCCGDDISDTYVDSGKLCVNGSIRKAGFFDSVEYKAFGEERAVWCFDQTCSMLTPTRVALNGVVSPTPFEVTRSQPFSGTWKDKWLTANRNESIWTWFSTTDKGVLFTKDAATYVELNVELTARTFIHYQNLYIQNSAFEYVYDDRKAPFLQFKNGFLFAQPLSVAKTDPQNAGQWDVYITPSFEGWFTMDNVWLHMPQLSFFYEFSRSHALDTPYYTVNITRPRYYLSSNDLSKYYSCLDDSPIIFGLPNSPVSKCQEIGNTEYYCSPEGYFTNDYSHIQGSPLGANLRDNGDSCCPDNYCVLDGLCIADQSEDTNLQPKSNGQFCVAGSWVPASEKRFGTDSFTKGFCAKDSQCFVSAGAPCVDSGTVNQHLICNNGVWFARTINVSQVAQGFIGNANINSTYCDGIEFVVGKAKKLETFLGDENNPVLNHGCLVTSTDKTIKPVLAFSVNKIDNTYDALLGSTGQGLNLNCNGAEISVGDMKFKKCLTNVESPQSTPYFFNETYGIMVYDENNGGKLKSGTNIFVAIWQFFFGNTKDDLREISQDVQKSLEIATSQVITEDLFYYDNYGKKITATLSGYKVMNGPIPTDRYVLIINATGVTNSDVCERVDEYIAQHIVDGTLTKECVVTDDNLSLKVDSSNNLMNWLFQMLSAQLRQLQK